MCKEMAFNAIIMTAVITTTTATTGIYYNSSRRILLGKDQGIIRYSLGYTFPAEISLDNLKENLGLQVNCGSPKALPISYHIFQNIPLNVTNYFSHLLLCAVM